VGIPSLVFAYIGPDTLLPVTSALAGVLGVFLVFGRNTVHFTLQRFRRLFSKPAGGSSAGAANEHAHSCD